MNLPGILLRHPHWMRLITLLLALGGALLSAHIYRSAQVRNHQINLDYRARIAALELRDLGEADRALGSVIAVGLTSRGIQAAARSEHPIPAPSMLAGLGQQLGADGIFVLNGAGLITAGWDAEAHNVSGYRLADRPFFRQAIDGKPGLVAAVGSLNGRRAIFVAAPIRAGSDEASAGITSGVLAARLPIQTVDDQLTRFADAAVLLSPEGVVFASSRPEWLLHVTGDISEARHTTLAAHLRYGKQFSNSQTLRALTFEPAQAEVVLDNRAFNLSTATVEWNDPEGPWQLLLLEDPDKGGNPATRMALAASLGLLLFALLQSLIKIAQVREIRRLAADTERQLAEQRTRDAEARARLATFGSALQQARDVPRLSQVFFAHLTDFVPLHQGTLFIPLSEEKPDTLVLAGRYGCDDVPDTIEPGEGLLGECAHLQRPLYFDDPPAGFWRIRSGLGETAPRQLLLLPVIRQQRLLGVVELASLEAATQIRAQLENELLPILADNLELLLANRQMENALAHARQSQALAAGQKALQEDTTDWYAAILNGAPDGILVVNEQGHIVVANAAVERIFGYGPGELLQRPLETLLPPELRGGHTQLRRSFKGGEGETVRMSAERGTLRGLRQDGSDVAVSVSLALLPPLAGQGHCTCALIRSC